MQTNRVGRDDTFAHTLRAGTIASRNGSAIVTPTPLRTARRERCFCVMYMVALFSLSLIAVRYSQERFHASFLLLLSSFFFLLSCFLFLLSLSPLSSYVGGAAV